MRLNEQGHTAWVFRVGAAGPFTPGTVGIEMSLGLDSAVSPGYGLGLGGGTSRAVSTWADRLEGLFAGDFVGE